MPTYHGKISKAFFNSIEFTSLQGWSYSLEADTADSTVADTTNNGRTKEVGFKRGTASVTTLLSASVKVDETTAQATLELLRTSLNTDGGLAVSAQFINHEVGVDKNDVETLTYNFRMANSASNTVTLGA